MSDYRLPLEFATFITPDARSAGHTAELAVLSEELGYDLVVIQDHPYQQRFLDCWILLSWIASRTNQIRLMPGVLNMALRSPAMVAKEAASLDLLSDGRVELGLGAGFFWDRIVTMGVPRLTPGQAVNALQEAITIIRGVWDTQPRSSLTVNGDHHHVADLGRGPAPAHAIPLWIGADKPRMLKLTGREADGIMIAGPRNPGADLQDVNHQIDAAAGAAGRDPHAIRRMWGVRGQFQPNEDGFLHGPPAQWVRQLLPLVTQDGLTTLLLVADDAATIQRFAAEVMPPLTDAVNHQRS